MKRSKYTAAYGVMILLLSLIHPLNPGLGQDVGYLGPAYNGARSGPTGSKPESKLWFHDGTWWGVLWSEPSGAFTIHQLEFSTQSWEDSLVLVDTRHTSRADVLSVGDNLFIGTHQFNTDNGGNLSPTLLNKYDYVPGNGSVSGTYVPSPSSPTTISDRSFETLVIDQDSTGTLWATWRQDDRIYVSHTLDSQFQWAVPFVLPSNVSPVDSDDISTLVASGNEVAVFWSDQNRSEFLCSRHVAGSLPTDWLPAEVALQGPNAADDHISAKHDQLGALYAVVKSGTDTVMLLVRDTSGVWSQHIVATVEDNFTRPILILDEDARMVHIMGTSPNPKGSIYLKSSSMDLPAFESGSGRLIMEDFENSSINNVTSTKQSVSAFSGLVALAGDDVTDSYWHSFNPLGGEAPEPPLVDFIIETISNTVPAEINFYDRCGGFAEAWNWDFGDGNTSTVQNPTHVYSSPGTYSVTLLAANNSGFDVLTKDDFITISNTPVSETLFPMADAYIYQSSPNSNYGARDYLRARSGSSSYSSLLSFPATSVNDPVLSATLKLYCENGSNDGGQIYQIDGSWVESEVTYQNAPPFQGNPLATIGQVSSNTWVEIDVSAAQFNGETLSFGIKSSSSNSVFYTSREGGQSAPFRSPELAMVFDTSSPSAPTASFIADPLTGPSPLNIEFTDTSSGFPTQWEWDFGDGTTSSIRNPGHIYTLPGTYSVSLRAINGLGEDTYIAVDSITITPPVSSITQIASEDSFVSLQWPDSNYGGLSYLRARKNSTNDIRPFIKFSVQGITGTVSSARLRLFVEDGSPNSGSLFATSSAWDENVITFDNAPSLGDMIVTVGSVDAGGWIELDITNAITGDGVYSFAIQSGSGNSSYFTSREGTSPPELIIDYF